MDMTAVLDVVTNGVAAAAALGAAYLAFSGGIAVYNRLKSAAK
ncbi:hypothetical protein [Vibrio fluminensis]|nr:hypothetical protein [Vibrio fluminensis]